MWIIMIQFSRVTWNWHKRNSLLPHVTGNIFWSVSFKEKRKLKVARRKKIIKELLCAIFLN